MIARCQEGSFFHVMSWWNFQLQGCLYFFTEWRYLARPGKYDSLNFLAFILSCRKISCKISPKIKVKKVKDQLKFQDPTGFMSLFYDFEQFDLFRVKIGQNRKTVIFWYCTKMEITQVKNDLILNNRHKNIPKMWQ